MSIHIHILPRGLIGLERKGSTPAEDITVIDGTSTDLATVLPRSAVKGIDAPEPDAYTNVQAIVGVTSFGEGEKYLLAVTDRELACSIKGHDVWRSTAGLIVPLFESKDLAKNGEAEKLRTEYLEFITELLSSGHLCYSDSFDLTHSLQSQSQNTSKEPNPEYTFNHAALEPMLASRALKPFAVPFIAGFVGSFPLSISSETYTVTLIARYSRLRLGTRYTRRGLDSDGNAVNFVEMEQIVSSASSAQISSFVQIRGSVPTVWNQSLDLNWKPRMTISDQGSKATLQASTKHFSKLEREYLIPGTPGKLVCVDLLNRSGFEKPLADAYSELVKNLQDPRIDYEQFWVNRYCKRMDYGPLQLLLDQLKARLDANELFVGEMGANGVKGIKEQNGVVRTSCLDSLDRTNMVATLLAKDALIRQLSALGVPTSNSSWIMDSHSPMNNLYADAGDAISLIYSGTGHMKSDVVRTGRRQWIRGSWADGRNSLSRYYLNNFRDGIKQDLLDLWNGSVSHLDLLKDTDSDQSPESLIRSALEPPSLLDPDGTGLLRLPSITDIWQKAQTYSHATGVSSVLALWVLFGKWLSPRRVDSLLEFAVGIYVSFVFWVLVKVCGVDKRLIVSKPGISKEGERDGGGTGTKKDR